MPPILHWLTGNIGYHHVHHLNHQIPFYRLPEAMAAIPELQAPGRTSWSPAAIWACLRLKLWDPERNRLVSWREAGL
jgi:omega-6 fatty acid desaturase (delta-12 desaturase)